MDTVRLGGLLDGEPQVVAAGTPVLAEALQQQAVPVEQVDWRPPPEEAVEALNAVLGDPRHAAANATAVERMVAARPHLVDVRPASEAVIGEPGLGVHVDIDAIRIEEILGEPDQPLSGESLYVLEGDLVLGEQRAPAGSWVEVRKEMAGRYPKHQWPTDPAAAAPKRLKDR